MAVNTYEFLENAPANEVIDWLKNLGTFDPESESYQGELLSVLVGILRRQVILESQIRSAANVASCLANGITPD